MRVSWIGIPRHKIQRGLLGLLEFLLAPADFLAITPRPFIDPILLEVLFPPPTVGKDLSSAVSGTMLDPETNTQDRFLMSSCLQKGVNFRLL
jgi:hypothetical protein